MRAEKKVGHNLKIFCDCFCACSFKLIIHNYSVFRDCITYGIEEESLNEPCFTSGDQLF
jgi:hypothetical protein